METLYCEEEKNYNAYKKSKMKFIIWGAGDRGKYILYHLGKKNILAYIDLDQNKQGSLYENVQVIDFSQYLKKYKDICIIISTHEEEVVPFLQKNQIFHYFCMSDCPEDFQSPNPRHILRDAIKESIDVFKKYVVYGNSLYSILLYQWILDKETEEKPLLVMGKDCNQKIVEQAKKIWGENVYTEIPMEKCPFDKVFITIDDSGKSEEELTLKGIDSLENVMYYSEKVECYYNAKIQKFKGIHKGKRCFIIGTGPSLKNEDLDILKKNNELCISVNNIYLIFDRTNWRPDYYISTDYRQMQDSKKVEVLSLMKESVCFIADSNASFCEATHTDNIFIYHLGKFWKNKGRVPFSEEFAQIAYNNGTVTYAAMQLAVYMGCKEIYLLGVDASGINGKYEKYTHFYKEEVLKATCFSYQVYISYLSAKDYADKHGIEIYNATRGGELEVFRRINFDELF